MEGSSCHFGGMTSVQAHSDDHTHHADHTDHTGDNDHLNGIDHITIDPGMLYYGNTVVLLSTLNPDGTTNIAPMSSTWALGHTIVLGMGVGSRTATNLRERGEAVLNLPGVELWKQVERLGDTTGNTRGQVQHGHGSVPCADKFAAVGLDRQPSQTVSCDRVAQCRLQIEARVVGAAPDADGHFLIAQTHVQMVHADPAIVVPGTSHVDPRLWKPLIYNFRHYHTLGSQVGESAITETPSA